MAPHKARPHRSCIFTTAFIRTDVDPRVKELWERRFNGPAPFGNLRQMFIREHCTRVAPYGSDTCPYAQTECAMAFLSAVQAATAASVKSPTGYFRQLVRNSGARRAESKPLARNDEADRLAAEAALGQGHAGGLRGRDAAGRELHRAATGPVSIGSLLGSFDPRPHPGSVRPDGEASSER